MVAEKINLNRSLYADEKVKKLNKFERRRKILNINKTGKLRSDDNQLVVLNSYVGKQMKTLRVLIDSGAQENVITEKAAHRLGDSNLRPSKVKMVSAQGEDLPVLGQLNISLRFGNKQYTAETVCTPELIEGVDVILGMKFLNKHETSLTTQPGVSPKFTIDGKVIPIVRDQEKRISHRYSVFSLKHTEEDIVEWVKTTKDIIIPPRCIGTLKVKIPFNVDISQKTCLFHPNEVTDDLTVGEDESDFEIPEGVLKVHMSKKGKLYSYVQYINHSTESKKLKQGHIIGGVSMLGDNETEPSADSSDYSTVNAVKQLTSEQRWEKVKEVLKGKTIPGSAEEQALYRCMRVNQGVVQLPAEPFKTTQTVKHRIDYEGPETLFIPPYDIAHADIEDTNAAVEKLIEMKHVRRSKSGFNSPIIPVRKKDKTIRIVHDYRQINRFTKKQRFPLPKVDKILARLKGARYFVVLDLKSGYFQIPLEESSKPLTAFRTETGCYEYNSMCMGLTNSPSTMQRLMLNVITGLSHCHAFLDDLLIWGETLEECEVNLDKVLRRLVEHNLTIQTEKCSFFTNKCKYLGHVVTEKGVMPDPEKVQAIKDFPVPKNLFGVRSFLGLCGYYRKFIRGYSNIAAPLHDLTKGYSKRGKKIEVRWGEVEETAFNALKDAMTNDVVLYYPDFSKLFYLTTDASDIAIGGYLHQIDENGSDRPVLFFSKKLLDAETRYDIIDLEALAVVYGLKVSRPYILGREVEITSDNAPLVWMLKSANPSSRVARWQVLLSEYNITNIKHLAGKDNVVADALSRNIPVHDTLDQLLEEIPSLNTIAQGKSDDTIVDWNVSELGPEQDTVALYRELKKYLKGHRASLPRFVGAPLNQFQLEENILYLKTVNAYDKERYRVCLPPTYYEKALMLAHSIPISGHAGVNTTIERLKLFCYWPTIVRDAKQFVKTCKTCLKVKPDRGARSPILRNPEVEKPFDRCNMDLIGPVNVSDNGNRYILSMVDVLTRYGFAVAIPDKSTTTVARALMNNIIGQFGPPRSLYSDQGSEFTGKVMQEVLQLMNIKQRHITCYRPQASGLVERFNGTLCSILRALVYEHPQTWDLSLPLSTLAYNSSFHSVLMETPYYLFFLRDVNLPYDNILETPSPWYAYDDLKHELQIRAHTCYDLARKYIEAGQEQQEKYKNKRAKVRDIRVGDRVYVKRMKNVAKFSAKYLGPFRVVKMVGVIYWLRELATHKLVRVHAESLKLEDIVEL